MNIYLFWLLKKNKTEYLLFRLKCCCLRYLPAKENIKAKGNGVSIPLPSIPMPTSPAFVTCVGVCFRSLYAASHALPSCCNAYKPRTLQLKANIAIQLIRLKSKHHLYVIPLLYQLTTTYSNARRLIFYPRIHLASYLCAHTLRSVGSFNFMVFFFFVGVLCLAVCFQWAFLSIRAHLWCARFTDRIKPNAERARFVISLSRQNSMAKTRSNESCNPDDTLVYLLVPCK